MDWTADKSDEHGAIHRMYSTHYYDRVSGAHLEVLSIPEFVLPLGGSAKHPSGPLSADRIQQLLAVSNELLGGDAHVFRTVARRSSKDETPVRGPALSEGLEGPAFSIELLSERVAFDLMLGRAEHQAFRRQLEAPTVPVESSPPEMQAAVEIVRQAWGVLSPGVGGLVVTGAGAVVGFFTTPGRVVANEVAAIARRGVRNFTVAGRLQNENELLALRAENLDLKRKNQTLEQEARSSAQRLDESVETQK